MTTTTEFKQQEKSKERTEEYKVLLHLVTCGIEQGLFTGNQQQPFLTAVNRLLDKI